MEKSCEGNKERIGKVGGLEKNAQGTYKTTTNYTE